MTEKKRPVEKELLVILEEAIQVEIESAARYRRGVELSDIPEVKAMFERLVADEQSHERILKERYYDIKKRLGLKLMKDE